jgi:hypothetical protein
MMNSSSGLSRGLQNETVIFLTTDLPRNGETGFLEAREVPEVRKIPTLLGLYGLNAAIVPIEEDAGTVGIFVQGKATAILGESREFLDERDFVHAFKRSEPSDLAIVQAHLTRPSTTGGAALAFVEHGHEGILHG